MPICHYCKAKTDITLDGVDICEQCAVDRELARRQYEKVADRELPEPDKPVKRNGAPKWFVDDRDVRKDLMVRPNIARIGAFHLQFGWDDPVRHLKLELDSNSGKDLVQSLVVLPEYFNARGELLPKPKIDDSIILAVMWLSCRYKVAFVTSFLSRRDGDTYNIAYLIDDGRHWELSRKILPDDTRAYCKGSADATVAREHRGLWIGSLVCLDAVEPNDARHGLLAQTNRDRTVLCVPSRFQARGTSVETELPKGFAAVALASGAVCNSFLSVGEKQQAHTSGLRFLELKGSENN